MEMMEDDSSISSATMVDDVYDNCDDVDELDPPKALGDILESLAGAVFLDSGLSFEVVWQIFYPFFKPLIGKIQPNVYPCYDSKPYCNGDTQDICYN